MSAQEARDRLEALRIGYISNAKVNDHVIGPAILMTEDQAEALADRLEAADTLRRERDEALRQVPEWGVPSGDGPVPASVAAVMDALIEWDVAYVKPPGAACWIRLTLTAPEWDRDTAPIRAALATPPAPPIEPPLPSMPADLIQRLHDDLSAKKAKREARRLAAGIHIGDSATPPAGGTDG